MKVRIKRTYYNDYESIINEYMILESFNVYEENGQMYVDLESLDDLKTLHEIVEYPLIFEYNDKEDIIEVEIYDDYRE